MHLIPADNLEHALSIADAILGREKKITIIPEGLTSIIRVWRVPVTTNKIELLLVSKRFKKTIR